MAKMSAERRSLRRRIAVSTVLVFAVVGSFFFVLFAGSGNAQLHVKRRSPRGVSNEFDDCRPRLSPSNGSSQFPQDLFTMEQRRRGAVLLHVAGLIYMFVALAIVCDEFFVPSLTVLTDVLSISDDVAGATFMAAGGSAPEFFTSLFGVFVAQDNVGVGTIVGSATFNILCVLAFCTLFSRQVLHITWWPLFRDMSFYTFSLLLLLLFFYDEYIVWYEALIMFSIYMVYGVFMKFNGYLEYRVKEFLLRRFGIGKEEASRAQSIGRTPRSVLGSNREPRRSIPFIHGGNDVRRGIAQMAIGSEDEDGSSSQTSSARSERRRRRNSVHAKTIHVRPATTESNTSRIFIRTNNVPTVSGVVDGAKIHENGRPNGRDSKKGDTRNGTTTLTPVVNIEMNRPKGNTENGVSIPPIAIDNLSTTSSSAEQPLDLSWPDTNRKRFVFLLLAPIVFPLWLTLPDVRNLNRRKWFVLSFVGSILWIALFSYLMVWWANTIGETFGIPTEVMGLTILAAGTSIPDLITSVIVARKGLGDMAVSSSIGSNLFDVCVGLPIPWLIHFGLSLFKPGPVQNISVMSNGLACSLGLLFAMLIVLLACIALSRWRMDKLFGLLMIFSYAGFCMLCILLETGHIKCPLRNTC